MSRFLPQTAYEPPASTPYQLLPFRFTKLAGSEYVLTNAAGEYMVVPRPGLDALVSHQLPSGSELYRDLKAKHFLADGGSAALPIELLALKVRTKLNRLSEFTGLHLFVVTLRCEHSCPYCQVSRQSDDRTA